MKNRLINPNEMCMHSFLCKSKRKCQFGITINYKKPYLLNTKIKVESANKIRKKIGGILLEREPWKLGDHCWYRETSKL